MGGKLREVDVGGQAVLAGPSVFTMRWIFDELFDGKLADYVTLASGRSAVPPLLRRRLASSICSPTRRARAPPSRRFAGKRDADGYLKYRKHAAKIFEVVRGPFMENAVPSLFDFMSPRALWQMTQIDGMRSLWRALEEFFVDPRLRQLFGRYATYNGSSPYHAPATLAVIAHVENAYGIFAVEGGIVRLAEALRRRAEELGVVIACNADVDEIVVEPTGGPLATSLRARGVRVDGAVQWADCVIANCDVADAYGRLLGRRGDASRGASTRRRSCRCRPTCCSPSARRAPMELLHHNVFF